MTGRPFRKEFKAPLFCYRNRMGSSDMQDQERLSLPRAALLLKQNWRRTYDMVLRGDLPAEQDQSGRWQVRLADVLALKATRGD